MKFLSIMILAIVSMCAVACGSSKPTANSAPSVKTAKSVQVHNRFASASFNLVPGDTLNSSNGTWTDTPTSYTYQWQSCDANGASCTAISGATNARYTVVSGDVGNTLRTVVTACNSKGCTSKTSDQTDVVASTAPNTTFCNIPTAYTNLTTGPHLCGWPDSTNTGYTHAPGYPGSLTLATSGSSTCPTTVQSNHNYNFCDWVYNVNAGSNPNALNIPANTVNVTFYGSNFEVTNPQNPNVGFTGGTATSNNITFDYDTFKPAVVDSPPVTCDQTYQYGINNEGGVVRKLTVTHSDFWGFGNAITTASSTQTDPQYFAYNWIHDTVSDAITTDTCGYHTDGIGYEGGNSSGSIPESYATVDHNTIQMIGNTNDIAWQQGTYDHIQNTNNLLGGDNESYAPARCNPPGCTLPTNITTTGNTFSTFLPIFATPLDGSAHPWATAGSSWSNNFWAVPPGAQWGTPAFNGYFWVPTGDSNYPQDCGFVSATDYPNVTNPPPCR